MCSLEEERQKLLSCDLLGLLLGTGERFSTLFATQLPQSKEIDCATPLEKTYFFLFCVQVPKKVKNQNRYRTRRLARVSALQLASVVLSTHTVIHTYISSADHQQ